MGKLSKEKKITEENIADAVREVRLALLDADVNYGIASRFVKRVKEAAIGETVLKSVSPGEQFSKIVHDELVKLMGEGESEIVCKGAPTLLMLCGLQGAGKTTQCAKLANHLKKQGKTVAMIPCDRQRPAAIEQLKTLGSSIDIPVFDLEGVSDAVKVAKKGLKEAKEQSIDVVIFDTAGRLHIDEALMKELVKLKKEVNPHEIFFVASANAGQDAVNTAVKFDEDIGITGSILTMLDGNARAGAAISIREVTGKPLVFEGVGEKIEDLQVFNPESMADRILGMGDVINLVKKAQDHFSEDESEELEKKMRKASFTYDDYLKQMGRIKKMGSIKGLMKMMPGMGSLPDVDISDKEFLKLESMILSMTPRERYCLDELEPTRRRRIAKGSGTSMDDVNRLVKGFKQLRQMMKKMGGFGGKMKNDPELKKILSKLG
ncbi:MAG: signal recognition particle protein [Simkaniaceae bacterium]|nr:signal recognition particle protein [Simkaniaceae bacterium]